MGSLFLRSFFMVLSLFFVFSLPDAFSLTFFALVLIFLSAAVKNALWILFSGRSCLCFLFSAAASKSFAAALEKSTDGTFCSYASGSFLFLLFHFSGRILSYVFINFGFPTNVECL